MSDISTFGAHSTMSYYYKLILIVIVGSVASWFAVQKLVTSTAYVAKGLTISTINELSIDSTLIIPKTLDNEPSEITVQRVANAEPAAESAGENQPQNANTESPAVSDEAAEENSESEDPEAVRADSDADMQANDDKQQQEQSVAQKEQSSTVGTSSLESTSATSLAKLDQALELAAPTKQASTSPSPSQSQSPSQSVASKTVANDTSGTPPKSKLPTNERQIQPLALNTTLSSTIEPNQVIKPAKPKAIQALDLAYSVPPESVCKGTINGEPRVGILYRPTSFAIKGQSLSDIDKLIGLYKKCGGKLQVLENSLSAEESEQRLIQLRQDEVKYYLLQRRVSKEDMIFPDNS